MDGRDEFLKLFLKQETDLRAFIGSLLLDPNRGEDVLQEVALTLWQQFDASPDPIGGPNPQPFANPNQVLDDRVLVDGAFAQSVPEGSAIRVAEEVPAAICLADGSRAVFEPSTQAVLHGPVAGIRQVVELVEGSGTFQVEKGDGEFQVETRWGRVTALV